MGGGGIGGIGEIASGGGFSSMLSGDFDLGKMAGLASNFLPLPTISRPALRRDCLVRVAWAASTRQA